MKKKADIILSGELTGRNIEVTASDNVSNIGIKGIILDETKNMIALETKKGKKKIIKKGKAFMIDGIRIKGDDLAARPEERIKKWLKRKK